MENKRKRSETKSKAKKKKTRFEIVPQKPIEEPIEVKEESENEEEESEDEVEGIQDVDENNQEEIEVKEDEDEEEEEPVKKGSSFGSALASILQSEVEDEDPILSKSKVAKSRELKEKKEKKAREKIRLAAKARRQLINKDHVSPKITDGYELEYKLKKIATKGVIQLFNVINKQQKDESIGEAKNEEQAQKLSKTKFLELLKQTKKQ